MTLMLKLAFEYGSLKLEPRFRNQATATANPVTQVVQEETNLQIFVQHLLKSVKLCKLSMDN